MKKAVDDLLAMPQPQRQKIYDAVRHDMEFTKDTSVSFSFQTVELDEMEQQIIKNFFLYFHKERFRLESGFALEGLSEKPYGRKEFVGKYFDVENKQLQHICPVCLLQTTNAKKEHDVEHYFPKAFIPCLALHPDNLYFSCKSCNQVYKEEKKHTDDSRNADIRHIFLPYVDTVRDKVKIKFKYESGHDSLFFAPADPGEDFIEDKIKTFDYFFELQKRWSEMLECYYQNLAEEFEEPDLYDEAVLGEEALYQKMNADWQKKQRNIMKKPACYVETRYREWMCQKDSVQFKAFYSNLTQKGTEAKTI
ncbi:MAG: hypothetical protein NC321_10250 [Clostridium sp.]|nr:hypothetical protein [Clostridium sp.]